MEDKTTNRPFLLTKDVRRDLDTMFEQAQAAIRAADDVDEAARILEDLKLQIKQIKRARGRDQEATA